jgi:hypothetical protein
MNILIKLCMKKNPIFPFRLNLPTCDDGVHVVVRAHVQEKKTGEALVLKK